MLRLRNLFLCFTLAFFLFAAQNVFAYNNNSLSINLSCDNSSPINSEEFAMYINFVPSENINVSAFRLKINFDSSKLAYKGLYSYANNDDFKSYENNGTLTILYVTTEKGFNVKKDISQPILELNFKVFSDCEIGSTEISATIDGLCDYDATAIPLPTIEPALVNISQPEVANCDLASLSNDEYQLIPDFSPDITHYTVNVPYSKSTIEFKAEPVDADATVKVNRKTLKGAGSSTDITLTVTSADKKTKKIYTICVNRLNKESSTSNSMITSTSKNSTKNKNSSYNDDVLIDDVYDDETYTGNNEKINNENTIAVDPENDVDFDENIAQNNKIAIENSSAPLVVKESSFNFILFFVISFIFIIFSAFIIKRKKNNVN